MRIIANPYLQARALWFSGEFAGLLQNVYVSQYVMFAASALAASQPFPCKLGGLKAIIK
jgi:hypothetical protein